jgi:N-acetyltransferase
MAISSIVHGNLVDEQTRCIHYNTPKDIIAIKMKCCNAYYACITCHNEIANHQPVVWPLHEFDTKVILCGGCKNELTISTYLNSNYTCPYCAAAFNPKCSNHNHLYFQQINFNLQPILRNDLVVAIPLVENDFEALYVAASDPLIWEQHPNKNRWQLADFKNYFKGAMESGGAFLVKDAVTNEVIGSSRYANNKTKIELSIGYTFFKRSHWGTGHNTALKKLMLDYAFNFIDVVYFYIGGVNKRSQIAISRVGAKKVREEQTAYYGEAPKLDFVYAIEKSDWTSNKK